MKIRLNWDILKKSHKHEEDTRPNRKKVIRYSPDTCCMNPCPVQMIEELGFVCKNCGETIE